MNKRFYAAAVLAIALILPILMLSNYVNTEADPPSGVCGDFVYTYTGTYATITEYTGSLPDLVIPGELNGKTVTNIGDDAFAENTFLTSVIIPDSVKTIGDRTFSQCANLTSVTLGNNVISLGYEAFSQCTNLISVTLGNSMESMSTRAFSQCTSLTSIDIPDSSRILGDEAFSQCTSLTSVTIGNQVTILGQKTFSQCTSLTSVTIGIKLEIIGYKAFSECTSLTSIDIPDNVKTLGDMVFSQCTNLTSVTTGDGVKSISGGAFLLCTSLTSVTMGSGVTHIETGAFWDCTSLTSVTVGNSVKTIDAGAFRDCTSLESVTVGNSVSSIGPETFKGCGSLKYIRFLGSAPAVGDEWAPSNIEIFYYPSYSGCFDETADGWEDKTLGPLPGYDVTLASVANIPDQTYTGSPIEPDPIVTLKGIVLVKNVDYSLSYTDNIGVKTVTVTVTGTNTYYKGSITTDFEIVKRKITVTPDDGQSKTYGGTDPALTYSLSEAIDVSGSLYRDTGENVGTYAIWTSALVPANSNYELVPVTADFTITKATLTATYRGGTVTFGSPPALTVSVTGFVNGETELTAAGYTAPTVTNININVGTYTLSPSGGAGANYVFSCVAGNLVITPQEFVITPVAGLSMTYSGSAPSDLAFTETLPDGVGSTGTLTIGTIYNAGTYKILRGTLASDSPNYVFAVDETVDYIISPKEVTVTPDALSKAYNQTDPVLTYTLSEPISVTGTLSRTTGEGAGTYAMTLGSLEPVLGNYILTLAPSNFEIVAEGTGGTEDTESGTAEIDADSAPLFYFPDSMQSMS